MCHVWSRVMLTWGCNVTVHNYVVFTHRDITSWHHQWCHLACVLGPIKGLVPHHLGFTPGSSPDGWGGTHARIDWHTGVPMLLEPTSFKLNWLGCYQFSLSIHPMDVLIPSDNCPGFDLTSTISTGLACLLVGAHMHCLSSCQVYISQSILLLGETIHPTLHMSQLLVHLGGCQLNMTWVARTLISFLLSCDLSHQV